MPRARMLAPFAPRGRPRKVGFAAFDLSGRVAVVTGGGTGIGRAIALGLAQAGADVIPTSRRREVIDTAAAEIEALSRKTLRVTSDVAEEASLEAVLVAAIDRFGKVDVLVNAAGTTKRAPTLEMTERCWKWPRTRPAKRRSRRSRNRSPSNGPARAWSSTPSRRACSGRR